MKFPEIHKMATISTAHLTQADMRLLDGTSKKHKGERTPEVHDINYMSSFCESEFSVIVNVESCLENYFDIRARYGPRVDDIYAADVVGILREAKKQDIAYLCFDADGPTVPDLKTYTW